MMAAIKPEPFSEEPVTFEDGSRFGMGTISDLFSMEEVGDRLGLLSPSVMIQAEEEEREPLLSLKEGSSGADRTLSSLNAGAGRLISFESLPSTKSLGAMDTTPSSSSPSSDETEEDSVMQEEKPVVTVKPEVVDNDNVQGLSAIMTKPTITRPVKREQTPVRCAPPHERKRPGRKRLELPSEEEVQHITDPVMKKRLQNRKASRECRARKADYLGEIEEKVRKLESQNAELSFKYGQVVEERTKVNNENAILRLRLDQFERHFKSMNISHLKEIAVC